MRITVHHNLLAKEPWEQIRTIYSKPEVFSQCRQLAGAAAKDRDMQPAASTSRAAEMASDQPGVAAIGSTLAGELYGLHCCSRTSRTTRTTQTRFFVIGREAARRSGDDKTAIMFTTAHKPGALAEVLDVFKENGINLTDIEKRPSKKVNWEYYFFIDAEAHAGRPGDADGDRGGAAALPAVDGAGELSAGDGSAVATVGPAVPAADFKRSPGRGRTCPALGVCRGTRLGKPCRYEERPRRTRPAQPALRQTCHWLPESPRPPVIGFDDGGPCDFGDVPAGSLREMRRVIVLGRAAGPVVGIGSGVGWAWR